MKFNPTFLEILIFLTVCILIFIWTKYGRKIRRWLQDYFRRHRGPRSLKPKSPEDCPLGTRDICFLPHRSKLEIIPWSERKSPRGRPKTSDTSGHACLNPLCDYFAVADPEIHALVSNGLSRSAKDSLLEMPGMWRLSNKQIGHTALLVENTANPYCDGDNRHVRRGRYLSRKPHLWSSHHHHHPLDRALWPT